MHKNFELILFDWSGTISDDRLVVHQANSLMCKYYGIPPITDLNQFLSQTARGPQEYFHAKGITAPSEEIWNLYKKCFTQIISEHLKPVMYETVPKTLKSLKQKQKTLAIISSHPQKNLYSEAEGYNIKTYFKLIEGDVLNKSEAIKKAITELGKSISQTMYIGDMISDILAAKLAGVYSVGVTTGYHTRAMLKAQNPNILIEDLTKLEEVI